MSSNFNLSGTTYPTDIPSDPTKAPPSSTRQDLPPNLDPQIKAYEQTVGNPTKKASGGSVSQGTASVGKEGDHGGGQEGDKAGDEDKGPLDKAKETLSPTS
ncbi:MAG: hypothetical protein Q9162_001153 [Coniocarpon cinnabarinum]